jgi:hypothetical protein
MKISPEVAIILMMTGETERLSDAGFEAGSSLLCNTKCLSTG